MVHARGCLTQSKGFKRLVSSLQKVTVGLKPARTMCRTADTSGISVVYVGTLSCLVANLEISLSSFVSGDSAI